jgi:hypothetical protein
MNFMSEDIIKVVFGMMVVVVIAALFILTGLEIQQIEAPIDIGVSFIIGGIVGFIIIIVAIFALLRR